MQRGKFMFTQFSAFRCGSFVFYALTSVLFRLSRTAISNAALPKIMQAGMCYRLQYPFSCKISVQGLKRALEVS